MFKHILAVFCGIAFGSSTLIAQQPPDSLFEDRVKIENWIKNNHVPALGIAVLRDKVIREIKIFGELKHGTPAPYNAIFNVASLTKPIVAVLTLKLVSNGSWTLDEPLHKYWVDPDLRDDPRHKLLTTRLVLSHQTGFKNWRYLNKDNKLAFDTTPGTRFGYSGEGFEYLRKALENKFNQPLERLTDSLLFTPLGMHDTRHKWDSHTDGTRFAHWYDASGKEHPNDYKATGVSAADDLLTTLEDYGKFAAYVMNGAGMDKRIFDQMVRPHVPTKNTASMTLGWEMFTDLGPKKEYAILHSGSDRGVKTLVILLPVSGEGLIIFCNGDAGNKLYGPIITALLTAGEDMMSRVGQ